MCKNWTTWDSICPLSQGPSSHWKWVNWLLFYRKGCNNHPQHFPGRCTMGWLTIGGIPPTSSKFKKLLCVAFFPSVPPKLACSPYFCSHASTKGEMKLKATPFFSVLTSERTPNQTFFGGGGGVRMLRWRYYRATHGSKRTIPGKAQNWKLASHDVWYNEKNTHCWHLSFSSCILFSRVSLFWVSVLRECRSWLMVNSSFSKYFLASSIDLVRL